jgi:hypothetical protein
MGALPVYSLATNALLEFIAPRHDARRNPAENLRFGSRTKRFVAVHASSERTKTPGQIKTPHYLSHLTAAVRLAQPIPMSHGGMFEQTAVPRKEDALLFGGDPHQFRVDGAIAIRNIEPKHAQIGSQPAEMDIERELRLAQGLRAEAQLRRDFQ